MQDGTATFNTNSERFIYTLVIKISNKVIYINKDNKQIIEKAIKGVKKFPVRLIDIYKESMPFSRRTFHRGVLELVDEGKLSIEKKSFGRGLGIFVMITSAKL